jgi:hypothetical protein
MQQPEQRRDRAGQKAVQDFGEPELFRHKTSF